jgi:hypothetical protein
MSGQPLNAKDLRGPESRKYLALVPVFKYFGSMANGSEFSALERLLRPLSREFTLELARALVKIQADEETQARYEVLAEKRTEGQLTADELVELESIVRANTLLGVLKAEAHALLSDAPS